MTDVGWFGGSEPRSEDEDRFLKHLRIRASGWSVPGLLPEASGCLAVLTPLIVTVSHPALEGSFGLTELQVGYWSATSWGLKLEGEWGDGSLLDNGGDDTDLHVQGVQEDPEFFAALAADWLEAQLLRPVERAEWLKGARVVAYRVRLAGGGQTLATQGSWLRTRRSPNRTVALS